MMKKGNGESMLIRIKYDYIPKYFKTCRKKEHNDMECRIINPELHKRLEECEKEHTNEKQIVGTIAATTM